MARERNYRNLKVWRAAHDLSVRVYRVTCAFPAEHQFGLTSQLRRSSASIAQNLVEGCGRTTDAAFAHYVELAYASAGEVDQELLYARDIELIDQRTYTELFATVDEVRRMLASLRRTLRS